jgi:hypothetical protein
MYLKHEFHDPCILIKYLKSFSLDYLSMTDRTIFSIVSNAENLVLRWQDA